MNCFGGRLLLIVPSMAEVHCRMMNMKLKILVRTAAGRNKTRAPAGAKPCTGACVK